MEQKWCRYCALIFCLGLILHYCWEDIISKHAHVPIHIEEVGLLSRTQWGWYLLRLRVVRNVFFGSLFGRNSHESMGDGPTLTKLKPLFRRVLAHTLCSDDTTIKAVGAETGTDVKEREGQRVERSRRWRKEQFSHSVMVIVLKGKVARERREKARRGRLGMWF